jgi:hypothetical protein
MLVIGHIFPSVAPNMRRCGSDDQKIRSLSNVKRRNVPRPHINSMLPGQEEVKCPNQTQKSAKAAQILDRGDPKTGEFLSPSKKVSGNRVMDGKSSSAG